MSSNTPFLRRTNWGQLGLELVVVVVGILMALSIDSVLADRRNAGLEKDFLGQLREDLARAESQISGEMAVTIEAEEHTLRLLDFARGDAVVSSDTLATWLIRALQFSDPRPTVSTAQALAESENLYLLRSPALRAAVTTMIDRIRQLESRLVPFEQRIIDVQSTLNRWAPPPDRGLPQSVGMFSSGMDVLRSDAPSSVTMDLKPIVRRPDLASAIDEAFWAHENLRWYQQEMIAATIELRKAVETELRSR